MRLAALALLLSGCGISVAHLNFVRPTPEIVTVASGQSVVFGTFRDARKQTYSAELGGPKVIGNPWENQYAALDMTPTEALQRSTEDVFAKAGFALVPPGAAPPPDALTVEGTLEECDVDVRGSTVYAKLRFSLAFKRGDKVVASREFEGNEDGHSGFGWGREFESVAAEYLTDIYGKTMTDLGKYLGSPGLLKAVSPPAAASVAAPSAAPSAAGKLVISTTPPGATISIDTEPAGTSPIAVDKLLPGEHLVQAKWPDGKTASGVAKVSAGSSSVLQLAAP